MGILSSELIDAHVHVGQFRDTYFSPKAVANFLLGLCVTRCVASATSAAIGRHEDAVRDIAELMDISELETAPLLWVTPELLRRHPMLGKPLMDNPYRGIKLHPYAMHWTDAGLRRVLRIADDRGLPVLAHTGGNDESDAGRWLRLLDGHRFPVVLAHGRPLDEALRVLDAHECAYTDTAFMPLPDVRHLVAAGHCRRILFGSDIPIDRCYRSGPPARRYREHVAALARAVSPHEKTIFETNGLKVFFT
jgi:predicted TIM-barrel fold metal-dependent hydrolase